MTGGTGRSLLRVAGIVAAATLLSKAMGLARQLLIAAVFGSGAEYSAFAIAYVLPGFLFVLLGGINGPFHSAIVSVLKKRTDRDHARWIESISTLVGVVLLGVTLVLELFADAVVQLSAPGASPEVHRLAAQQLRIMAPLALLGGWIGIGFGTLNAADRFLLPSLSPLLSSLALIILLLVLGRDADPSLLAWGTLIGAVAQWLVQVPAQARLGLGSFRPRFDWGSPQVQTVGMLMLPAVISSGMVHINVYVDLFFASFVPGDRTIGNLGYAQLLVQTPLGILSNMVLVPFMPLFSSLAVPDRWPELRQRIRQGLVVTALTILPLSMPLVTLGEPIVRLTYERGRFTPEVTQEVAALLVAYALGMLFYLLRDVVVRIFYALEDSRTPLLVTTSAIGLNALFDWIGIQLFGAAGVALSTAAVNTIACVWLGILLQRRLGGLPWAEILSTLAALIGLTVVAGGITFGSWQGLQTLLPGSGFGLMLIEISLSVGLGWAAFGIGARLAQIPEAAAVEGRLRGWLRRA